MCRHHRHGADAPNEQSLGGEGPRAAATGDGDADPPAPVTMPRRRYLAASAAVAGAALAGCGGNGEVPAAVTLTDADSCDVCGMIITAHPGPNAEIFYANNAPEGHDNPAHFCSTWEAFQYDFRKQDEGWQREVFYVTDYSSVDYEVYTESGKTFITSHPEASAFVDATTVTFVVRSDVNGAMGKDLIAFGEEADAEAFQGEYGGDLLSFGDVDEQTIAGLGMG